MKIAAQSNKGEDILACWLKNWSLSTEDSSGDTTVFKHFHETFSEINPWRVGVGGGEEGLKEEWVGGGMKQNLSSWGCSTHYH